MAYVAIGAPPIVEGDTAEVKSHAKTTLNDANQPICFSDKNLILEAENHILKKETMTAMASPGNLFGAR
jgi:hypothetical protein|tara:strand:+ start:256472 stop:256678 length:207 start_codon:yes stop_codon:yes gene_type:complete